MGKQAGYFGEFGGRYSPEILYEVLEELGQSFARARKDPQFWRAYRQELTTYSGRPTPITFAPRLTEHFGGAKIYIKREDLNHTGAHKINNAIGQGLLAKYMGKTRLIAETGAGQHGVATATVAARLGLPATIYMGQVDAKRQRPNVFWMERLGAKVIEVTQGYQTLKEAINEAFRDWSAHFETTHYLLGTACGPDPFPTMVAWFHTVIGEEAFHQMQELKEHFSKVYACVGGGSNALGIFSGFMPKALIDELGFASPDWQGMRSETKPIELVGVEAGGKGSGFGKHAMRLAKDAGRLGIAQGYKTYFLSNEEGQMQETHSIAAGIDYIGVSPILAYLKQLEKVRFEATTDQEVIDAVSLTMQKEGMIPALESAHAFAQAFKEAPLLAKDQAILIHQSGRGDKDIFNFGEAFQDPKWKSFIQNKPFSY